MNFAGGAGAFVKPRGYFLFALLACVISTMTSPAIGVCSLSLGGFAVWDKFWDIWLIWWLGDAVGMLVIAPFLALWLTPAPGTFAWSDVLRFLAMLAAVAVPSNL